MAAGMASALALAAPGRAQEINEGRFTTAEEVRPILEATRGSWIAVREFDGQDLLYVTQILSWRCGLDSLTISVNGAPAEPWEMEPCHLDTAQPNALVMEDILPYRRYPLGSVETIDVTLGLDDGSTLEGRFERAAVQIN